MKKREFLMLAETYQPEKFNISGWMASEKLDGMRALWLPTTRGLFADSVRFANTEKDARLKDIVIATGLWSRYGKVIRAPDWWCENLPPYPLDGELWMGRGKFQDLMKVVKTFEGSDWSDVQFCILDAPTYDEIFVPGQINNPNFKKMITHSEKLEGPILTGDRYFDLRYKRMKERIPVSPNLIVHEQIQLPMSSLLCEEEINKMLLKITKEGGEGLILRSPVHEWHPIRSKNVLKMKKVLDSEATVIGYVLGTKRLEGMLGALRVHWNGKVFDIGTGFTDLDRGFLFKCNNNPGEFVAHEGLSSKFPLGIKITFLYRELSNEGIPKEARFFRRAE